MILRVLESVLPQSSVTVNERSLFPKGRAPMFLISPEKNNRMLLTLLCCSFSWWCISYIPFQWRIQGFKNRVGGGIPARYIFWGLMIVLIPLSIIPYPFVVRGENKIPIYKKTLNVDYNKVYAVKIFKNKPLKKSNWWARALCAGAGSPFAFQRSFFKIEDKVLIMIVWGLTSYRQYSRHVTEVLS